MEGAAMATDSIALYPTPDQIAALLAGPPNQPVVMLNLLRLKPQADAPDAGMSGEAAFRLYMADMLPFVVKHGGRVLWSGRIDGQVIGSGAGGFQQAALVEYPSRQVFVQIATSDEVRGFGVHRAAGLEGQWLLATTTEILATS
jgi:hypothetical protein